MPESVGLRGVTNWQPNAKRKKLRSKGSAKASTARHRAMKATAGKARIETEDRKKNASALLASTEKRAELPLAVAPVTQLAVAPVTQKASSPSFFFWPDAPDCDDDAVDVWDATDGYEQVIGRPAAAYGASNKRNPAVAGGVCPYERKGTVRPSWDFDSSSR